MDSIPHKICAHCKQSKPLSDFSKGRDQKDGYRATCKVCRNAHRRATRNDRARAQRRSYDKTRLQNDPIYREKERVRQKEKQTRRYRESNAYRAQQREHSKNGARKLMNDPVRYAAHLQRTSQRAKLWRKTRPRWAERQRIKERINAHRRRDRERGAPSTLTPAQWQDILRQQSYTCLRCGRKFGPHLKPEMDHVRPLNDGAPLSYENCQALCRSCNASKGARHIDYRTLQQYRLPGLD